MIVRSRDDYYSQECIIVCLWGRASSPKRGKHSGRFEVMPESGSLVLITVKTIYARTMGFERETGATPPIGVLGETSLKNSGT